VRDTRGMTLVELAVALALLTILSATAMVTVATFLHGAEVSQVVSGLVGDLAEARMRAIATATRHRVLFPAHSNPASTVVTGYQLCAEPCAEPDLIRHVTLTDSMGIEIPAGTAIEFMASGRNSLATDTALTICRIETKQDGSIACDPSASTKRVTVYGSTGVITY